MDAAAARRKRRLHVVVFPWLAFGHLIPFLELAKRLAARGHAAVTFLSTPRNLSRLAGAGAVPPELSAFVRFVPLPLPRVEGLPDGAESTTDVTQEEIGLLKKAFDGLAAPFAAFLADACCGGSGGGEGEDDDEADGFGRKPDWIVVDFAHYWVPPIADEHKVHFHTQISLYSMRPIPFLLFHAQKSRTATPATAADAEEHLMTPATTTTTASNTLPSDLAYRRHEAKFIAAAFKPNASGVSDADRATLLRRRCAVVFYRSCSEAEGPPCRLLADVPAPRFLPTGLLAPSPSTAGGNDDDHAAGELMRWLDAQPERSVLYVALGTEAPLTPANIRELARGLDLSGERFLWALRAFPAEAISSRRGTRRSWLGEDMWRVRVLGHVAVGAFLTHCGSTWGGFNYGWGSTVESLQFGLPLVMLPFIIDQGIVAQAMAAKGIGAEVKRDYDDGSFRGEDVAAAMRRVMVEEDGKVFVRNARTMQEELADTERQEH
uniref:Glycosyltransferase n=1 Tax=Leersia perrieri TaxID=77586 RepID=A0A0D9WWL7_9ORYZ